uniref:Uncharacterized protein n=1 Tax=Rhizophora mucronata TaxID=61149 RepID=A0A2P2QKG5_RHIMU
MVNVTPCASLLGRLPPLIN